MTTAFGLIAKVLRLQVPARVILFGLLNKYNYFTKSGNRRYEFERLYLEEKDPWNYHSSSYELEKYNRTLECILSFRKSSESALELGCSVGVFSKLLSEKFSNLTAVDISKEALASAAKYNVDRRNIKFIRSDIQSLAENARFDVITCAEVLYYIPERDADLVCRKLDEHLAESGVVVMVTGVSGGQPNPFYFDDWERVLSAYFELVHKETVSDPSRPYEMFAFRRRN